MWWAGHKRQHHHPIAQAIPQGAVISPLLANIYLDPLDHQMAGRGREMIRYADDFILCRSQAQEALAEVAAWVNEAGLVLHPEKTRIVDASQPGGLDFLGWHFERGWNWPREKSVKRFKEVLRDQTSRTDGRSLPETIGGCAAGRATSPAGTAPSTPGWTNGCG